MTRLNLASIVAVGLLNGVILNVIGTIGNGLVLRDAWEQVAGKVQPPQFGGIGQVLLAVVGLLSDFVLAWSLVGLYAAAKPGLGAGIGTAAKVATTLWVVGVVMPYSGLVRLGIVPVGLAASTCIVALASFVPAVWLTVKLYRDPSTMPSGAESPRGL